MPEQTNNVGSPERAALAVEAFNQAESTYKQGEITAMLNAGQAIATWVEATGQDQGSFPVPKQSRWASKGAISTLHSAFQHWGLKVDSCSKKVDQYRKVYGSKVSTLTALNGARKGNVREWQADAKAKAEAREQSANTRKARDEAEAAKAPETPDTRSAQFVTNLSELSDEAFNALMVAVKNEYDRRETLRRATEATPNVASASQPTRAA